MYNYLYKVWIDLVVSMHLFACTHVCYRKCIEHVTSNYVVLQCYTYLLMSIIRRPVANWSLMAIFDTISDVMTRYSKCTTPYTICLWRKSFNGLQIFTDYHCTVLLDMTPYSLYYVTVISSISLIVQCCSIGQCESLINKIPFWKDFKISILHLKGHTSVVTHDHCQI